MSYTISNNPLTIRQILEHASSIHGNKEVYTQLSNGNIYSIPYSKLHARIMQLANVMDEFGVQQNDIVSTFSTNTYQHLELYYAIPITGAIIHSINTKLSSNQLTKIVNDVENKLIFVDGLIYDIYKHLNLEIDRKKIVLFNNHNTGADTSDQYDNLLSNADKNYKTEISDENLPMALCYTSGTNGEPKGVLYTHRTMFLHTLAVNQSDVFGLTEKDVVMPLVPMYHAMGWGLHFAAMFVGADLVLTDANNNNIVDLIAETKVTVAAGVPTVWRKLLPEMQKRRQDVTSLRKLIVGGEPMPAKLIETYEREFHIEIRQAWGMTELNPTGTFSTLRKKHDKLSEEERWEIKAMQGQPVPGVQIRIVDENQCILEWDGNSVGEIQVKCVWAAGQYLNNQSGEDEYTDEGWLCTGDLATINPDGYIRIVDRAKSMIKSGGEAISPMELEKALMKHPNVVDSAVIGIKNEKWGERPIAIVTVSDQLDTDIPKLLKEHLSTEFPKFWIPDKFFVLNRIPKTGTGKTNKVSLLKELGVT